jgi:hypothetical protein
MSAKEIVDAILKLLEILISWPVILLVVMVVARKELLSLILKLADRMTKAPGGFEFATLQERVEKISTQLDKLEKAAFEPSGALTPKLQSDLQASFDAYQAYLLGVGYKPPMEGKVNIFVDPTLDNAQYDGQRIVIGKRLAEDSDALYRECTHRALDPNNRWGLMTDEQKAVESGLADYFPCSYKNNPLFGEKAVEVFRHIPEYANKPALRTMDNDRKFTEAAMNNEEHNVGEIWSGAFWKIRARVGQSDTDKLLYSAFTAMPPLKDGASFNVSFANAVIDAARTLPKGDQSGDIAAIFKRRKFKL